MGIPAQKYIVPETPPNGFVKRFEGEVEENDLIWSTSEGKYMEASKFDARGLPVKSFWGVAKKA